MSPLVCYQRNTYVCTYTLIGMNLLSYDMLGGFQKKVVAIKENNYDIYAWWFSKESCEHKGK